MAMSCLRDRWPLPKIRPLRQPPYRCATARFEFVWRRPCHHLPCALRASLALRDADRLDRDVPQLVVRPLDIWSRYDNCTRCGRPIPIVWSTPAGEPPARQAAPVPERHPPFPASAEMPCRSGRATAAARPHWRQRPMANTKRWRTAAAPTRWLLLPNACATIRACGRMADCSPACVWGRQSYVALLTMAARTTEMIPCQLPLA